MDSTQNINSSNLNIKEKKVYAYDKERKKMMMREYFLNNKDIKKECPDCGLMTNIFNLSHHKKSKYHNNVIKFLEKKQCN